MKSIESIRPVQTPDKSLEKKIGTKSYTLESGQTVDVAWKEFDAESKSENNQENDKKAFIFLPGWAMEADAGAIDGLCKNFAEESNNQTYAITSRREKLGQEEDRVLEQAEAISRFIKEKGLKEVTLAGHSQGGMKAVDLAVLLQEDPSITIKGLILLDAVGLYEQKGLAKGFIGDMAATTKVLSPGIGDDNRSTGSRWSVMKKGIQAAVSVGAGIGKDIKKSNPIGFAKRLNEDIEDMSKKNPNMEKVRVPIVLISGVDDPISTPEKIVPAAETNLISEKFNQKKKERQEQEIEADTYINPREEYLKKNVFPESPYIRVVAPEKFGRHSMALIRNESVAKVSMHLLDRYNKKEDRSKKTDNFAWSLDQESKKKKIEDLKDDITKLY